ncbi:MAG: hypothetical protein IJD10_07840 [Clostridia bacterium]|nr:hypothetical protein [Clostridia bacterium]
MRYYPFLFADETEKKAFAALCEAEYRARLDEIATIAAQRRGLRFLTLAGPTCSGKTTTANILIDKLRAVGHRVVIVSIDDFFYDRAHLRARAEETGEPYDMDSVKAIDLNALRAFVSDITEGKPSTLPRFNFAEGRREVGETVVPHPEDIYLFEGIQAVYPEVTALFPREAMLSLYISVEETVATEGGIWLPREIRLLRRLLRDSKFRDTDAETTFAHWGGVVRNELASIEPHKNGCDYTIDSTMPYELCVLRTPLIPLLEAVGEGSDYRLTARLLTEKLERLPTVSADYVPSDSVLREFIGGKEFQ